MVPYLAPFSWYSHWLRGLLSGLDDSMARSEASRLCGVKGKLWCRSCCPSPAGGAVTLSIPIVGGASAIKRNSPESLMVSGHGEWPRTHIGALEAAYGRAPFYRHLEPDVCHILHNAPGNPLPDVCEAIHLTIYRMLCLPDVLPSLRQALADNPFRFLGIAKELKGKISDPSENFLGILAEYGPDAIFSLIE